VRDIAPFPLRKARFGPLEGFLENPTRSGPGSFSFWRWGSPGTGFLRSLRRKSTLEKRQVESYFFFSWEVGVRGKDVFPPGGAGKEFPFSAMFFFRNLWEKVCICGPPREVPWATSLRAHMMSFCETGHSFFLGLWRFYRARGGRPVPFSPAARLLERREFRSGWKSDHGPTFSKERCVQEFFLSRTPFSPARRGGEPEEAPLKRLSPGALFEGGGIRTRGRAFQVLPPPIAHRNREPLPPPSGKERGFSRVPGKGRTSLL